MKTLNVLLTASILFAGTLFATDRKELFKVPDFKELPPQTKVMWEKTIDGVVIQELQFQGASFAGSPTTIYGWYARPQAPGKYPGVVNLHGAGLVAQLGNKGPVFYAKNGFACLSIDWAGPRDWAGKHEARTIPCSEFDNPGIMAEKGHIFGSEVDTITNGVRFVERAFMFLRSRPEVDSSNLFLSGASAGAHLSLLVLGVDRGIKGAAVKYGCGYIRDFPTYFGGYFGPLTQVPKDEQDTWLAALDPKHGIPDFKANVLMLSGTNDIFFAMPLVLETYRQIPSGKNLLMLPNDNHSQVANDEIPLRFFQSCMGTQPALPAIQSPTAKQEGEALGLQVKITAPSPLSKVEFWFKRMPSKAFFHGGGEKWQSVAAEEKDGVWCAAVPAVGPDEQLVAYATAEDQTGAKASSDTVEVPDFPKWRGK